MYAYQIRKCLEQDPIVMNDIYSADELPNHEIQKRPSLIIANTGLSWTLGEHWTVIYYAEIGGINEFLTVLGDIQVLAINCLPHFWSKMKTNMSTIQSNYKAKEVVFVDSTVCFTVTISVEANLCMM